HDDIPPVLAVDDDPIGVPGPGSLFRPFRGDEDVAEHHFRSGVQFQAGLWLDQDETLQALGEVFVLESDRAATRVNSYGSPSVGRLFVNGFTAEPAQELVASPGERFGVAEV